MRFTLEINEALLDAMRSRAADEGVSLDVVANCALAAGLRREAQGRVRPFRMITYGQGPQVHHEPTDFKAFEEEDDILRYKKSCG